MKKTKFAVCLLLIVATILTFSLPVVADDSGEDTKDTVKKDDSFYLSRETLDRIGDFDKIKVDEDTKYLTVYQGWIGDLNKTNIDEFISLFDGVKYPFGDGINDYAHVPRDEMWRFARQKVIIGTSSDGSSQVRFFLLNGPDGSLEEQNERYNPFIRKLVERNEYIPEKVMSASINDNIIKCIDSEIKVKDIYLIESLASADLYGWSVYFKTDKGDYIYFCHDSIKEGDYLFPAYDLVDMIMLSKKEKEADYSNPVIGCSGDIDFSAIWPAEILDRYDVNSENFFVKTGWKNDFSWVKVDEPVDDDPVKTDDALPDETGVDNGIDNGTDNDQVLAANPGADVIDDLKTDGNQTPIAVIVIASLLVLAIGGSVAVILIRKKKAGIH